jgi:hypothetical protein
MFFVSSFFEQDRAGVIIINQHGVIEYNRITKLRQHYLLWLFRGDQGHGRRNMACAFRSCLLMNNIEHGFQQL